MPNFSHTQYHWQFNQCFTTKWEVTKKNALWPKLKWTHRENCLKQHYVLYHSYPFRVHTRTRLTPGISKLEYRMPCKRSDFKQLPCDEALTVIKKETGYFLLVCNNVCLEWLFLQLLTLHEQWFWDTLLGKNFLRSGYTCSSQVEMGIWHLPACTHYTSAPLCVTLDNRWLCDWKFCSHYIQYISL